MEYSYARAIIRSENAVNRTFSKALLTSAVDAILCGKAGDSRDTMCAEYVRDNIAKCARP